MSSGHPFCAKYNTHSSCVGVLYTVFLDCLLTLFSICRLFGESASPYWLGCLDKLSTLTGQIVLRRPSVLIVTKPLCFKRLMLRLMVRSLTWYSSAMTALDLKKVWSPQLNESMSPHRILSTGCSCGCSSISRGIHSPLNCLIQYFDFKYVRLRKLLGFHDVCCPDPIAFVVVVCVNVSFHLIFRFASL